MNENSKLRVAYICGNPTYSLKDASGYATHIRELTIGLTQNGCEVLNFLPRQDKNYSFQSVKPSTFRKFIPSFFWELAKDINRIRLDYFFKTKIEKEIQKEKIDLIYERLDFSGGIIGSWAKKLSIPYVLEIHSPLEEETIKLSGKRPLRFIFNKKVKKTLTQSNHVVAISGMVSTWVEKQGISKNKISVIPNGVNLSFFSKTSNSGSLNSIRKSKEDIVVGYVGSAMAWHGLSDLLYATQKANKQVPIILVIVGISSGDQRLKDLSRELNIEKITHFTGPISYEEIPAFIQQFDVGVMPKSNSYGSPIKIFEYGAMGKAIIAPSTSPILEVMEPEKDGILIPNGDVEALAEALIRLGKNPELRRKVGENFRRKVYSNFGWEHAGNKLTSVFRQVKSQLEAF